MNCARFALVTTFVFCLLAGISHASSLAQFNELQVGSIHISGTHDETQLRHFAEEAQELLEAHVSFLQDFGFSNTTITPLKITMLKNAEEYQTFKAKSGTRSESPRGFYEHNQRHIVTWETMHVGFSSELRRILAHETVHHQLHSALGHNIPLWLDEGLAVLFESAPLVRGMRLDLKGEHSAAKSQVKNAMKHKQMHALSKLLEIKRNEFYSNNIQRNYSQAWSFVHFLLNDPIHRNNRTIEAMFGAIKLGNNPTQALELITGKTVAQLEADWHQYIKSL